ncbi:hypothetical protein [Filimonas effusa]|uniref:Uncharacterized protein n=1 Tax=Filimonas effusa TaxID=2508721 RepID=A0A4V1M9G6_9BACT|nr:hypothetical protein [Filimonas effusa]RXK81032.1 hypothetical protein ESB13_23040 [Filimonas effusa]
MTPEAMQAAWQASTQKLEAVKAVNEELVKEIVSLRSQSVFQTIKKRYVRLIMLLLFYMGIFSLIIITDPFDYELKRPYIPLGLISAVYLFFIVSAIIAWRRMNRKPMDQMNMVQSLQKVIAEHDRIRSWFNFAFFTTGTLFAVTITPDLIANRGIKIAMQWLVIMFILPAVELLLAYKLILNDPTGKKMKQALSEIKQRLEELKS